ncbi:lysosome membrane protein 2-like [Cylas formicarius]|uniref:lysosome membrane protein 2-like n=1 Tax=Cylas formicarius TaxID=197179 RepID=UPI002958472A|nr:lysosome membrane protein 2-like [Cylas formicarius]
MELRYGLSRGMLSVAAVGILMVCTSTLMFFHDPLEMIIRLVLNLSEGSIFYSLWSQPPYEVLLKIYIFNVTNSEEFLKGDEKMNLTQIGPYVYKEILTNNNATFDEDRGTVTYKPHREVVLDHERSVGDPKTDKLITPNIPLLGLQSYLNEASFFTNLAFSTFARSIGSKPIIDLTIDQYLWGYEDKLIDYAHQYLPSWIDFKRFGLLERLLSRDNNNRVTIVKDPSKYHSATDHYLTEEERLSQYHVVEWNDSPGLLDWGYKNLNGTSGQVKKCHLVEGAYDGTIFPRDLRPNRRVTLFRKAFCRPVPLEFIKDKTTNQGFRAFEYKLADDMFDVIPENECFCYKGKCVKGIQSIAPCYYGIPIALSQPHFLNAEPRLLDTVNGLKPDVGAHGSVCSIQPDLGVPLDGHLRIQINLDIGQTKYNSRTRVFNDLNIPLFWIEVTTTELPSLVVFLLTLICTVVPIVLVILKYVLVLGGLAMISGTAAYVVFKARMSIPAGISLNSEYTAIPLISIPNEYLHKMEKRLSLK